jgi:hypothetical protein
VGSLKYSLREFKFATRPYVSLDLLGAFPALLLRLAFCCRPGDSFRLRRKNAAITTVAAYECKKPAKLAWTAKFAESFT